MTTSPPLTAGPQMDALVAEQVMGWGRSKGGLYRPGGDPKNIRDYRDVPRYSTDIAAAWLVVEKLIADGWFPDVQFNDWGTESWHATLMRRTDDERADGYHGAQAASAPLAICRAALAALSAPSLETDDA